MERVQQQEVAIARRELEVEVASAMEAYPGVPREVLLQAVVADPDAAVIKVAESYSTHLAQIEEAAIARYLEENPAPAVETQEVAEKPKAAPRPTRSGAADSDAATGPVELYGIACRNGTVVTGIGCWSNIRELGKV